MEEIDKQPEMSPKLADVARYAGVSTATVSRCLNTPDSVSEKTRSKVMQAVDTLGYAPNFNARALAARRTNTFGAIIPTMDNAIFALALQAFQEELDRHGITLLVASSSYSPKTEEEQIRALIARGADALLLVGHDRTGRSYELLEKRQIPFVVAWAFDPARPRIDIGFDNRKAMRGLATEVIGLGHRRLAAISGPQDGNDRARGRVDGIRDAMALSGLNSESLSLIETPYSISNGAEAFERLLTGPEPPSAILCGNDVLAAGALVGARKLGVSVPEMVSVTGFDGIEIAEIISPGITTVQVPHGEMGKRAAQQLLEMRNGPGQASSVELDVSILWRESLGPAP